MDEELMVKLNGSERAFGVTRETVDLLRERLGIASDNELAHLALAQLRDQMQPQYALDDGPVSDAMLAYIRERVDQTPPKRCRSL